MKPITYAAPLILLTAFNCAAAAEPKKTVKPEEASGTSSLVVELNDDARRILDAIPQESAMERLETLDTNGRRISYIALTDTEFGGLVFANGKLAGTVSRQDAKAFYSCRGYVTTTQMHWARESTEWISTLLLAMTPASGPVTLNFSGKSTQWSLKEVVNNQALLQLASIVDIGTNPLGILRKLNTANDNMREREKYEKTLQSLKAIAVGSSEQQVADALRPEEVFFGNGALILAYPRFAYEFYVNGSVAVAQQPSFYKLSRTRTALFYVPNARWEQCTSKNWKNALPEVNTEKTAR